LHSRFFTKEVEHELLARVDEAANSAPSEIKTPAEKKYLLDQEFTEERFASAARDFG
jgi:hypothetical protein